MPENENIIPEAEVVETVRASSKSVSFSPVSNSQEDDFVAVEEETVVRSCCSIQEEIVEEVVEDEYRDNRTNEDSAILSRI
jgi:hypothetical protein